MARLGELERAVMDVLWTTGRPMAATEVMSELKVDLAVTTVLTVLVRLGNKHLVTREREGRAYRYTPSTSREDLVAETMVEALGGSDDRGAALARFIDTVSPADAELLRRALEDR